VLRADLQQIQAAGAELPRDDITGEHCVCSLVRAYGQSGTAVIERKVETDGKPIPTE
jgi:hypothetical protein